MSNEDVCSATSSEKHIGSLPIDYFFPFVKDARFLTHPNKDLLWKFAGPENTIPHVKLAIEELDIHHKLSVTRLIPPTDQQWRIIPETGIACRAVSSEAIELLFDPDNQYTIDSLNCWSGRQIAHELNHIARMNAFPLHATLLDALISEGLAVYYEEHWQGNFSKSQWRRVLSEEQSRTEWLKAQKELFSPAFDFADWFYGRRNGHPIYTGYSLGEAIVAGFFNKNQNLLMVNAARLPSIEILNESGFIHS